MRIFCPATVVPLLRAVYDVVLACVASTPEVGRVGPSQRTPPPHPLHHGGGPNLRTWCSRDSSVRDLAVRQPGTARHATATPSEQPDDSVRRRGPNSNPRWTLAHIRRETGKQGHPRPGD